MVYDPQVQSLKDQKLRRLVEQLKAGIKGEASNAVVPQKSIPEPKSEDVSVAQKKDETQLKTMGEQLKILVEKAQRHAQSKQGIPYMQELPGHVSWMSAEINITNVLSR